MSTSFFWTSTFPDTISPFSGLTRNLPDLKPSLILPRTKIINPRENLRRFHDNLTASDTEIRNKTSPNTNNQHNRRITREWRGQLPSYHRKSKSETRNGDAIPSPKKKQQNKKIKKKEKKNKEKNRKDHHRDSGIKTEKAMPPELSPRRSQQCRSSPTIRRRSGANQRGETCSVRTCRREFGGPDFERERLQQRERERGAGFKEGASPRGRDFTNKTRPKTKGFKFNARNFGQSKRRLALQIFELPPTL